MLSMLASVTPNTEVTKELKDLWQQLGLWERVARFLGNKYLLSRWASLLVGAFYVCIYVYVALLFSFVYFGIARITGLNMPWSEAAVDSIFPVYVTELPKTFFMRFAGGVQWSLIVILGLGTFWNYFHKRLEAVHASAIEIGGLLTDETVRERYKLLESKVKPAKTTAVTHEPNEKRKNRTTPTEAVTFSLLLRNESSVFTSTLVPSD